MALSDLSPDEIVKRWPTKPPKPLKQYTTAELVALKKFGPATIGGALYLASQRAVEETKDNRFGEAILSKSDKPVEYISLRKPA